MQLQVNIKRKSISKNLSVLVHLKGLVCIFAFGENEGSARSSPRERCLPAPQLTFRVPSSVND